MIERPPHDKPTVHLYAAFAFGPADGETVVVALLNRGPRWKAAAMKLREVTDPALAGARALSYGLEQLKLPCRVVVVTSDDALPAGLASEHLRPQTAPARATWGSIDGAFSTTHELVACRQLRGNSVILLLEEFAREAARLSPREIDARLEGLAAASRAATEHQYLESKECQPTHGEDTTVCNICDGGLAVCKVCGLFEGSLTTHCPGSKSHGRSEEVYAGGVDFFHGEWTAGRASLHLPPSPSEGADYVQGSGRRYAYVRGGETVTRDEMLGPGFAQVETFYEDARGEVGHVVRRRRSDAVLFEICDWAVYCTGYEVEAIALSYIRRADGMYLARDVWAEVGEKYFWTANPAEAIRTDRERAQAALELLRSDRSHTGWLAVEAVAA
jgi:hypothetical protein